MKKHGDKLPSRIIFHAVEKFGKTSFAAHSPAPIFLLPADETGLLTLIDAGRLPETPYLLVRNWSEALDAIEWLTTGEHDRKTLVVDTLNSLEKMCHQHVCDREYAGDWGKKGFANYQQGYGVSTSEWRVFLAALDRLRETKRMSIIGTAHTRVVTFKNPGDLDFDRYVPDMHDKTWSITHKWADAILFGQFFTEVVEDGNRAKGKGGQARVIYTERHAAYDAGNRFGLPEEIECGKSGAEAWNNFIAAMKTAKGVTQ